MEPMIDICSVTVYRQDLKVLDHFSLQLATGEKVAILGPNGAGKSTLLKLITRELYPVVAPGSYIKLSGSETINLWQLRSQMGLVSHDLQHDYTPYTSGRDVVLSGFFGAIGQHDHLQASEQQQQRVDEVLAQLDITDLQSRMYQRLSTGQQRRFLLARAMVHNPQLYILDEPSAGLDLASSHRLLNHVRQVCQQGMGLLLATHHLEEVVPEVERVVLLKKGRVLYDGPKTEVLTSQNLSELYELPVEVSEHGGWYRAHCVA
ncbi:MAG: ATP-binding cassette domain-containing protein [Marinobacterium sp.]|nr:ATP-binding cassette domain-containing protein [Marinobacterium sp.]